MIYATQVQTSTPHKASSPRASRGHPDISQGLENAVAPYKCAFPCFFKSEH